MSRPAKSNFVSTRVKTVLPKGNVLNDNGTDADHLGHVVYADALSRQIQSIKTPMSIGIFARWGSGKSFLLKHVQSLLTIQQKQSELAEKESKRMSYRTRHKLNIVFAVVVLIVLTALSVLSIHFSSALQKTPTIAISITLMAILYILYLVALRFGGDWFADGWFKYSKVLAFALFTRLPLRKMKAPIIRVTPEEKVKLKQENKVEEQNKFEQKSYKAYNASCCLMCCCALCPCWKCRNKKKRKPKKTREARKAKNLRRFVFVNFNAWEYAGSDTLWAGIATTLADRIEDEFGVMLSRLFRAIELDTIARDKKNIIAKNKTIYVKIDSKIGKEKVSGIMSDYGVIKSCDVHYKNGAEVWWTVKYSKPFQAMAALRSLVQQGLDARSLDPNFSKQNNHSLHNQNNQQNQENLSRHGVQSADKIEAKLEKNQPKPTKLYSYYRRHPRRTCEVTNFNWLMLFILAAVLIPIVLTCVLLLPGGPQITTGETAAIEVASFVPFGLGVFYSFFKVIWSMLHSHRKRMIQALEGAKANLANELGFMNKVKDEVEAITNLVHAVEFVYGVEYKVVITIDDLDRVPLLKVKSVLESISILLSDRWSPFICLVAIDSRIAVKCFEVMEGENERTYDGKDKPIVNGYEYMKKIINLPFCIPQIDSRAKKRFIAGLMDEADDTTEHYEDRPVTPRLQISIRKDFGKSDISNSSVATQYRIEESIQHIHTFKGESSHDAVRTIFRRRSSPKMSVRPFRSGSNQLDAIAIAGNMSREDIELKEIKSSPWEEQEYYCDVERNRTELIFKVEHGSKYGEGDKAILIFMKSTFQKLDTIQVGDRLVYIDNASCFPLIYQAFLERLDQDRPQLIASAMFSNKNTDKENRCVKMVFHGFESEKEYTRLGFRAFKQGSKESANVVRVQKETLQNSSQQVLEVVQPKRRFVKVETEVNVQIHSAQVERNEDSALETIPLQSITEQQSEDSSSKSFVSERRASVNVSADAGRVSPLVCNRISGEPAHFPVLQGSQTNQQDDNEKIIDFKDFLFTCRNFMFENDAVVRNIMGNPRNIKRIFNVISITASVIRCHQERREKERFLRKIREQKSIRHDSVITEQDLDEKNKRLAEDIVLWVILTDQWPFRISYILQVIEDSDQRSNAGREKDAIDDSTYLFDLYNDHFRKEIGSTPEVETNMLILDADPDILYGLLKLIKTECRLNKGRVKELLPYTINLDPSLKHAISLTRDKMDLLPSQSTLSSVASMAATTPKRMASYDDSPLCHMCNNGPTNCTCRGDWLSSANDLLHCIKKESSYFPGGRSCFLCAMEWHKCACERKLLEINRYIREVDVVAVRELVRNQCVVCGKRPVMCRCKESLRAWESYLNEKLLTQDRPERHSEPIERERNVFSRAKQMQSYAQGQAIPHQARYVVDSGQASPPTPQPEKLETNAGNYSVSDAGDVLMNIN